MMIEPDWNWFMSSMAQSSAAIVGVLIAFLVSRVLSNGVQYSEIKVHARQLLDRSLEIEEKVGNLRFSWLNRRDMESALGDTVRHATRSRFAFDEDQEGPLTPDGYYSRFDFPRFVPRDVAIEQIRVAIEEEEQRLEAARVASERRRSLGGLPAISEAINIPRSSNAIWETKLQTDREDESDKIDDIIVEIRQHIRTLEHCAADVRANQRSPKFIAGGSAAAFALFVFGVCLPLILMPASGPPSFALSVDAATGVLQSWQFILLLPVILVISGVLGYLVWATSRMTFCADDLETLEGRMRLGAYSPFLQVMVDNSQRTEPPFIQTAPEVSSPQSLTNE